MLEKLGPGPVNLPPEGAPMIEYALAYAEAGLAVFPIKEGTKDKYYNYPEFRSPETGKDNSWKYQASTDPKRIRRFWTDHPNANIGVVTGKASGGAYILDFDREKKTDGKTKKDGFTRLLEWEKETGNSGISAADTWEVLTGSGGRHLWFSLPGSDGLRGSSEIFKDGAGCDTRGDGNYVVMPPSLHPNGTRYTWKKRPDRPMAAAPDCFRSYWAGASAPDPAGAKRDIPRGLEDLENCTGGRHDALKGYIASTIARTGGKLSEKEYIELLRVANNHLQNPIGEGDGDSFERTVAPMVASILRMEAAKDFDDTAAAPLRSVDLTPLDQIEEQEAEWLIPGYIPKYSITILAGEGGQGKTAIWCNIVAAISSGQPCILDADPYESDDSWMYGHAAEPIRRDPETVVFFSAEDSVTYVLKKRLRQAGANDKNIHSIETGSDAARRIRVNSPEFEEVLRRYRPKLVVFDPLQGFLPDDVNMAARNDMRQCLSALVGMGEKYGTTFLIVMHANKMAGAWGRKDWQTHQICGTLPALS